MDFQKRKEYFVLTIVCFGMGFIIFGMMAVSNKELLGITFNTCLVLLLYGFGGGVLVGGLISGIILFSNFVKNKKLFFKIIICILFPLTLILICYVGILSFLPYEIYNFIVMKKMSKREN